MAVSNSIIEVSQQQWQNVNKLLNEKDKEIILLKEQLLLEKRFRSHLEDDFNNMLEQLNLQVSAQKSY